MNLEVPRSRWIIGFGNCARNQDRAIGLERGQIEETPGRRLLPQKSGKRRRKFPFLAGAVVLVALAVIGVEVRSSRTQVVRQRSQPAAELEVTVVHPQKASITIPALPGQTEAYTDAPIHAQTSGYLALRRPYTFIVLAIFMLIAGVLSILSTPKDIFPSINIPVISVIFPFPEMSPQDLEEHLTTVYERILTTTVDNIEHIESESRFGIAVVKIYLQPSASVPRAIAQVTSVSQFIIKFLPSGTTPPLVLSYSATNVPVLRVGLSGLSEQQINDLGFIAKPT